MSFAARAIPLYGADPYPNASVALDFVRGFYKAPGASGGSLSALSGFSFSRTGTETDLATGAIQFATGVPAILPGLGLQVYEARTNIFAAPTAPATQSITISATGNYVVHVIGSGSATSSAGTATGTGFGAATAGSPNVFNISATGSVTITISGSPTFVNVQAGAFITPIIPLGSATRGAASASVGGLSTTTGDWTLFGEFIVPNAAANNPRPLFWDDGAGTAAIDVFVAASGTTMQVNVNGATQGNAGTLTAGQSVKFAASRSGSNFQYAIGGVLSVPTTPTFGTTYSRLIIGNNSAANRSFDSTIKRTWVSPTASSAAQLTSLTQ